MKKYIFLFLLCLINLISNESTFIYSSKILKRFYDVDGYIIYLSDSKYTEDCSVFKIYPISKRAQTWNEWWYNIDPLQPEDCYISDYKNWKKDDGIKLYKYNWEGISIEEIKKYNDPAISETTYLLENTKLEKYAFVKKINSPFNILINYMIFPVSYDYKAYLKDIHEFGIGLDVDDYDRIERVFGALIKAICNSYDMKLSYIRRKEYEEAKYDLSFKNNDYNWENYINTYNDAMLQKTALILSFEYSPQNIFEGVIIEPKIFNEILDEFKIVITNKLKDELDSKDEQSLIKQKRILTLATIKELLEFQDIIINAIIKRKTLEFNENNIEVLEYKIFSHLLLYMNEISIEEFKNLQVIPIDSEKIPKNVNTERLSIQINKIKLIKDSYDY